MQAFNPYPGYGQMSAGGFGDTVGYNGYNIPGPGINPLMGPNGQSINSFNANSPNRNSGPPGSGSFGRPSRSMHQNMFSSRNGTFSPNNNFRKSKLDSSFRRYVYING